MSSWRALLLRIGDRCPEYGGSTDHKEHIEACYGILMRDFEHSKDEILELILQCAEQLPHKIPFYGVLVGLINIDNEGFTQKIVHHTHNNLQDALQSSNCDSIRILLRFLAVLMCSKVILPNSVVEVFETLLSSAATTVDSKTGNPSWQPCADFYISCILACLPWCGLELYEQAPEDLERIIVGIQSYLTIRRRTSEKGLMVFIGDDETLLEEKDFLEDLFWRIQELSTSGWKADSVPKPHLQFEAQLVEGKSHNFPLILCPEQPEPPSSTSAISSEMQKHEAKLKFPQRLRRFNIFPADKIENLQAIDRFVVEEYLLDVLLFFNGCRKECAFYMVGLPVPFRYEFLMAETIFSQLLLLPNPPFRPIYYTLVIIDLCKALPGAFPAVVAGAVRSLFERIGDLDMECRIRLILWFSHHLSNFQFIWPWEEWAYVVALPKWAPQRVFVQEVLEREVRLSYWEKIKQSIDNVAALEDLLPSNGTPNFKYKSENGPEGGVGHLLSAELSSMVKGRKSVREIIAWVEEKVIPTHNYDIALEVVIQTLLDFGSKSFTHLITVLERYGQVIGRLCPNQEKQVQLIEEVSSYWKNNTQMTAIALDRMMGYRLLSNLAIIDWVFSSRNVDQFHLSDSPWEILRNAVMKTINRICDLRKEISSLEKSVVAAEESATKAKAELEAAESKLEIVDGEPVLAEKPGRLKRLKTYADKAIDEVTSIHESLEAKHALLARAAEENQALFISLYKNFANVLSNRLPIDVANGKIPKVDDDAMAVDLEGHASMETDRDDEKSSKAQINGERPGIEYKVGETEQWCHSTLGYAKALSRQYATEIWHHVEKLDAEVFYDAHPLLRKAVFTGLGRVMSAVI